MTFLHQIIVSRILKGHWYDKRTVAVTTFMGPEKYKMTREKSRNEKLKPANQQNKLEGK